jgi:hypothetical protein
MHKKTLLGIDALVNLLLGIALLAFPVHLAVYLGIPTPVSLFYPNLLGAVLFGIGIALGVELFRSPGWPAGLGLAGAIVINTCGALTLAYWLVSGRLAVTTPGAVFLWSVVILVFGLAIIETISARRGGDYLKP